jgi:hypothetical protein
MVLGGKERAVARRKLPPTTKKSVVIEVFSIGIVIDTNT